MHNPVNEVHLAQVSLNILFKLLIGSDGFRGAFGEWGGRGLSSNPPKSTQGSVANVYFPGFWSLPGSGLVLFIFKHSGSDFTYQTLTNYSLHISQFVIFVCLG